MDVEIAVRSFFDFFGKTRPGEDGVSFFSIIAVFLCVRSRTDLCGHDYNNLNYYTRESVEREVKSGSLELGL